MHNLTDQYLKLIDDITLKGGLLVSRNATVKRVWSPNPLVVDCCYTDFPLLRDRKHATSLAVLETCFFLAGRTDYDSMPLPLRQSFWEPWDATAKLYGSWGRFYPTHWRSQLCDKPATFDPLLHLLKQLAEVKKSGVANRKMVVSLWRTPDALTEYTVDVGVLESCHSTALVFNLSQSAGVWFLDMHHTQRSVDVMCGMPINLIYSGLVMHMIAQYIGVYPGKLVYAPVDAHIYESHLPLVPQLECVEGSTRLHLKANSLLDCLAENNPMTINDAKLFCQFVSDKPLPTNKIKFELIP